MYMDREMKKQEDWERFKVEDYGPKGLLMELNYYQTVEKMIAKETLDDAFLLVSFVICCIDKYRPELNENVNFANMWNI